MTVIKNTLVCSKKYGMVSPPYLFLLCLFFFEFVNWVSLSISNHLIWIGIKRLGWVYCMCGLHFLPQWWRNWSEQETIPGQLIFRNTKTWGSFIIQVFVWNKTIIGTGQGRKEIEILIRNHQNWEFCQCYVRFVDFKDLKRCHFLCSPSIEYAHSIQSRHWNWRGILLTVIITLST